MQNPQYLTISALTQYIKVKLENDQHLKKVLLKGEISNFKRHSSGHFYFSLKDDKASISVMMFQTYAKTIQFEPKEGDKVLVEGYISVYEARGTYSLSLYQMTLDGIGDLYLKYEKLKKEFEAMGYFSPDIKKPIPKFPKAIGVITSPTGAVIQDIKTTVSRRYLLTKVILYPVLVQGEGSKDDLVKKIRQANKDNLVDVIILGRGGGSIEDLWSFNEAEVVMAIYESKIPIITAIGHETDTTLSDHVSDLRAATPTAAAELATPNTVDLLNDIKEKRRLLDYYMFERMNRMRQQLLFLDERLQGMSPKTKLIQEKRSLNQTLLRLNLIYSNQLKDRLYKTNLLKQKLISPEEKIEKYHQRFNDLSEKMNYLFKNQITQKIYTYQNISDKIESLNPLKVMDRGFALTTKNKSVVTSIEDVCIGDILEVELKDGVIKTEVKEKEVK